MTKIALIGNTLNTMGGGERVTLTMLLALKAARFKVTLFTWDKPSEKIINKYFNMKSALNNIDHALPLSIRFKDLKDINSVDALLALLKFKYFKFRKKYSLIINSQGNTIAIPADITYVHFPSFALLSKKLSDIAKYHLKAYVSSLKDVIILKVRYKLYRALLEYARLVLVNSKFTKAFLERVANVNAKVLYPPVQVKSLVKLGKDSYRDNIVVTVSHFRRDKNLELIPLLALKVKDAKFIVIGKIHDYEYFIKLYKLIKSFKIENRVKLLPNVPRSELINILKRAKIYLHTMIMEHFGISVVEGMALGLIPVVHKSGGPWIDILNEKQGLYGYAYEDTEEAINHIENILSDETLRLRMIEIVKRRALQFDEEKFKLIFKTLVREFLRDRHWQAM